MNDLIPKNWSYDDSVKRLRPMIYKLKNLTIEIYYELWVAREILSNPGARTDLVENATRLETWSDYCNDIGIDRSTIHRWLEKYDPKSNKLIETFDKRKIVDKWIEDIKPVFKPKIYNIWKLSEEYLYGQINKEVMDNLDYYFGKYVLINSIGRTKEETEIKLKELISKKSPKIIVISDPFLHFDYFLMLDEKYKIEMDVILVYKIAQGFKKVLTYNEAKKEFDKLGHCLIVTADVMVMKLRMT